MLRPAVAFTRTVNKTSGYTAVNHRKSQKVTIHRPATLRSSGSKRQEGDKAVSTLLLISLPHKGFDNS
jgi:hypothetical protein